MTRPCFGIQIGLWPLWIYAGGLLMWLAFVIHILFDPPSQKGTPFSDVRRDIGSLCRTQRRGTVFLLEAACAWGDFVSDLSVALSICFPHVSLFVLMWVFIGVDVLPYMYMVFCIRPPAGCLLPPCGPLLDARHLYAGPLAEPAVAFAAWAAPAGWRLFCAGLLACWSPPGVSACAALAACRCAAALYCLVVGSCGLVIAIALGAIFLVLLIATAAVWGVLWLAAWILLVVLEVLLRLLLWAFGFLLYVTKLLPFPIKLTDLFFACWCGEDLTSARVQPMDDSRGVTPEDCQTSVFEMTYQGVNVFTLHFSYLSELLLESIAQLVIQILVASLGGGWSPNVIVSVVISSVMILMYLGRYLYWLVARPCMQGGPHRFHLLEMHRYYYSLTTDADQPEDSGSPAFE
mmetsp:Transcript_48991/g.151237  ORF Transcript_48991/g.151237 Transcript_48991/m.151237 type:complete len:404 (-) Transcript_48991:154-1365(-)